MQYLLLTFRLVALSAVFAFTAHAEPLELPATGVWNGFNRHINVLECSNLTETPVALRVTVKSNESEIIGVGNLSLGGYSTQHIILNNFDITNQYGTFVIETAEEEDSSTAQIGCHTAHYRFLAAEIGEGVEYAFSLPVGNPLRGPSSGIYNSINPEGTTRPVFNWLSIYNPGATSFTAQVNVYAQNGVKDDGQSFSVTSLRPGERRDFPLHREAEQVGLYTIEPVSNGAPYGAFLSRYSVLDHQRFNFAFPLLAKPGSCDSSILPASSMGNAFNWGEVANPTSRAITVELKVTDRNGALFDEQRQTIAPRSQFHLFLNRVIGANNVGLLQVRCVDHQVGDRVIAQSLYYGRNSLGSAKDRVGLRVPDS